MFGYASRELTYSCLPQNFLCASFNGASSRITPLGALPWLRPDAKSQVTFAYENGMPVRLDAVVLSTQHDPEISQS